MSSRRWLSRAVPSASPGGGRPALRRDKAWLLKPENLALVRHSRRCIQAEFDVKLRFDADDLLPDIQDYAGRSKNPALRHLALLIAYRLRCDRAPAGRDFPFANIPVVAPRRREGWPKGGA